MSEITSDWLRTRLIESFESRIKAMHFMNEKKHILNGKLYKYCPVNDIQADLEDRQYSIENLENSIVYMSRIKNFNDPFDTFISFSIDDIIQSFIPLLMEGNLGIEVDEATKHVLPSVFNLVMAPQQKTPKNNSITKHLVACIEKHPGILTGTEDPNLLLPDLLTSLSADLLNGKISQDELDAFSSIAENPNVLLAELLKEFIDSPSLLEKSGVSINEGDLTKVREVIDGKSPEIENARQEYLEAVDSIKPELVTAINKVRETVNEKYFVTCFSTNATNALMWAHYANKHKGFCVEYDLEKTQDFDLLVNLHPVIYSKKRASVPTSLFDLSELDNIKISTSNISTADLLCALLTKSRVWDYEDEWRLLLHDKVEGLHECKFEINCIGKVILGCQIEKQHEEKIAAICKKKGYHLSKMKLDDYEYKLHENIIF